MSVYVDGWMSEWERREQAVGKRDMRGEFQVLSSEF